MLGPVLRLIPIVFLAGCFGPFYRGTYDSRPDDTVLIARVHDDVRIELADGRTVRLFGVQVPAGQLREYEGKRASVEVLLPTDPPAVWLSIWERFGYCGLGLYTWDPFARPYEGFHGHCVVANAGRYHPVIESDLSHPDAPPHLVARLRKAAREREHGQR